MSHAASSKRTANPSSHKQQRRAHTAALLPNSLVVISTSRFWLLADVDGTSLSTCSALGGDSKMPSPCPQQTLPFRRSTTHQTHCLHPQNRIRSLEPSFNVIAQPCALSYRADVYSGVPCRTVKPSWWLRVSKADKASLAPRISRRRLDLVNRTISRRPQSTPLCEDGRKMYTTDVFPARLMHNDGVLSGWPST